MQEVQLDSKIKLLDSPGIVFSQGNDSSASLRNVVRVSSLLDPMTPANAILQRVTKQQMMEMYDLTEYNTPDVSSIKLLAEIYDVINLFLLGILCEKRCKDGQI